MNKTGKPIISRSYHIPLPMFDDAFLKFQKKYVYPGNLLLTVVLLAIAGVYIHAAVKDNSNTLVYLLIVACFAIILVRWYRTFKLRRAVHDALKEVETDTYQLSAYEDGLVIHTEEAAPAAEDAAAPQEAMQEPEQSADESPAEEGGFRKIFPDQPVQNDPVEDTEITFGPDVKIHDFPEYFMVYLVKRNFYVIPKKDFADDEIETLKKLFHV